MRIKIETSEMMVLEKSGIKGYVVAIIFTFLGLSIFLSGGRLFGIGVIIVGAVTFLMTKRIIVASDKNARKITIERKSILDRKTEEYDFQSVAYVEVYRKHLRGSRGNRNQRAINLAFVLSDNNRVLLDSSRSMSGRVLAFFVSKMISNDMIETGEKLAKFLGIPFQNNLQVDMSAVLSEVESAVDSLSQNFSDKK